MSRTCLALTFLALPASSQLGKPDQTISVAVTGISFGEAVSSAGDVNGDGYSDLIVGAPDFDGALVEQGRAMLYLGSPSGLSPDPAWFVVGGQSGAHLGWAVSLAGDVNGDGYTDVLVGAPHFDGAFADEGRALLFLGSPSGPSTTPDWTASGDQADAWFGDELQTAGDVNGDGYSDVVVGALLRDDVTSNEGAAFVFHGSPTGLSTTPDRALLGTQAGENHGYSVACAGDVNGDGYDDVIVGAPFWDSGSFANVGRAQLYFGSPTGVGATPDFTAFGSDSVADEDFGAAVAGAVDLNADGFDDLLVGAPGGPDPFFGSVLGLVYVYRGSESLPFQDDFLFGPGAGAGFGIALMSAGDFDGDGDGDAIVGSPYAAAGGTNRGQASLVFGGGASPSVYSVESGGSNGDFLGASVALIGDVDADGYNDWVVGAPGADEVHVHYGRALPFAPGPATTSAPGFNARSGQAGAQLGYSAACVGDVNGDGYDDLVAGAPFFDGAFPDEGFVDLHLGPKQASVSTPDWHRAGSQAGSNLGLAVSAAGDVNGDGRADVVVAEPGFDGAFVDEGRLLLFLGSNGGLRAAPAWQRRGGATNARYGEHIGAAGDVNGDGFGDVLIGSPNDDAGGTDAGRVELYFGAPSGLGTHADWTFVGTRPFAELGAAVASAGDVNGDGFDDVLAGAPRYDGGELDEGRVYLWLGGPAGPGATPTWTAETDDAGALFGYAVAGVGDIDADGYADVLIGAPEASPFGNGAAYLVRGSASGLGALEAIVPAVHLAFGRTVAGVDVNGDRYGDVAIGDPDLNRVWIYYGDATGLVPESTYHSRLRDGNSGSTAYGAALSTGDLNGDGYGDIVVGDPEFTRTLPNLVDEGKVSVVFGSAGGSSHLPAARALDPPDDGPLAPGGLSSSPSGLVVTAELLPTRGLPRFGSAATPTARLEVEVKPLGEPFDGNGTQLSAPVPVDPNETIVFELAVARTGGQRAPHRWRTRVLFDGNPLFRATAWRQPGAASPTETTVRFARRVRITPPLR